jgi:hypothetical protein
MRFAYLDKVAIEIKEAARMTWDTQLGLRSLSGVEAEFYLTAMQMTVDYLMEMAEMEEEPDFETGDRIFDSASFAQKAVLLHQCLSALLKPEVPAPQLTNLTEASAFAPFAFILMRIGEELEEESFWLKDEKYKTDEDLIYSYRQLAWNAYDRLVLASREPWEDDPDEEEFRLDYHTMDEPLWINVIDELASRIFFDRDWYITSYHPQLLDGMTEEFSEITDVASSYITNRLPIVTPEQVQAALVEIRNWKL